ncbi:YrbL family protein [Tichowtungia aerotolerans]|uniref:PhoP regulatory network protein YrbL n=1 Tax=Tichowtungia aerotolerans TaxID=2697043 RepID=A0A6P1M0K7_9BACT|nr:YrbL family protein [Tichowtungia aerotolerans]QHI68090.1 hypothetical protein GT409_01020 [Tichowtungia aerotolerans]
MIVLNDGLVFARGGRRVCYVHPDDASKCIKVLGPNGDPVKRREATPWYKRLRPLSMFDDNLRELKSFKVLEKHTDSVWNHFPRCYGISGTNCGPGIVTDLVRNADGSVPLTVQQYVAENGKTTELFAALETFFFLLRSEVVITRDILDHNIIVRDQGAGLVVVMIDGFGSSEVIPLSNWIKWFGIKKVERKIQRFKERYGFDSISS